MVVTPHNPLKNKDTLLKDSVRLQLVHLGTEDFPKIKPCDIEFNLPQPNYTVNTLAHLQDKYPKNEFSLIMGEDNLKSFHKWKNYEVILENHAIYVYPRVDENGQTNNDGEKYGFKNNPKIHFTAAPIVEISATFIRNSIKNKKNIQPLLPNKVWEYIDHNNLYRK
jgi:nicotinate-nucleotide adenylyltransferase